MISRFSRARNFKSLQGARLVTFKMKETDLNNIELYVQETFTGEFNASVENYLKKESVRNSVYTSTGLMGKYKYYSFFFENYQDATEYSIEFIKRTGLKNKNHFVYM